MRFQLADPERRVGLAEGQKIHFLDVVAGDGRHVPVEVNPPL